MPPKGHSVVMIMEKTRSPSKSELSPLMPAISESADTTDTDNTYDTCDTSGTVSVKTLDSLKSVLNDLFGRVTGLEKERSSGNNESEILPQIERATLLTERLDRDVQALQQGVDDLRLQMEALAVKVERGGGGGGGTDGGYSEECANTELTVLDCNQVSSYCIRSYNQGLID